MNRKFISIIMVMLFFAFSASAQKKVKQDIITEKGPAKVVTSIATKAVGDVTVLIADIDAITGVAANLGCEFDGTNYWITARNDTDGHQIFEIATDGTVLNTYLQGTTTTWGMRDLAYDETNDMLYAGDDNGFYSIDPDDGTVTEIFGFPIGSCIRALAIDGDGNFWTKSFAEDLYKFDIGGNILGQYAIANSSYGMAYDSHEDCIWLHATGSPDNQIVRVNMDGTLEGTVMDITGSISSVGGAFYDFGNLIPGKIIIGAIEQTGPPDIMWSIELGVAADPLAPDAPTALTATPDGGGGLTALVEWTNPAIDVSGGALGELTKIELFLDDNPTAIYTDNSPTINGDDSYNATVPDAGFHTFKVIGTNSFGDGIPATVTEWIGEDVPEAPDNVVLTKTDMDASVSWDTPAAGLHGGYFSGSGITYDVVRYPGAILVSDDQAGTTFDETLVDPGNYFYEITASNTTGEGGTGTSNTLIFGEFLLYEDFEAGAPDWTQEQIAGTIDWIFENGGHSGNPAAAYEGSLNALFYGGSYDGNTSKLISPEVGLSTTGAYNLSFFMAQVVWGVDQDELKVYYKDGAAGEWVELAHYPGEVASWTEETLQFTSTNAPYIAFEGIDGYGYGNCVDFVTIIEGVASTYTVTFNVHDQNDIALVGATVEVAGESGDTDANGEASFDLYEGEVTYTVTYGAEDPIEGTYVVTTDEGQIVDIEIIITNINNFNNSIIIYPNPSNGQFTISAEENYNLEVIDITGKIILTKELNQAQTDINLSQQKTGIYLIRLTNNENTFNYKIIIE